MPAAVTLENLRDHAVTRSLFEPTTLALAIERLGFVQADPIRAPARAQDLTLRHRALDYRAGDLERRYSELAIDEDYFVNYGFLPSAHLALMHPRVARRPWDRATKKRAEQIVAFVRERGEAHPREVEEHFDHGTITNYWGGSSNATTHVLDGLHYRGLLRVVRRDAGIRVYAPRGEWPLAEAQATTASRARALVDLAIAKYAPLPAPSLGPLVSRLRLGAPQLSDELKVALKAARRELPRAEVDGIEWFWPDGEDPREASKARDRVRDRVFLLAPFDPVVWDRRRFELFWGWAYRFEAYTPVRSRKLGYYALPLLWQNQVIGWANASLDAGELTTTFGYVTGRAPRDRAFKRALDEELDRMRVFLGATG